MAVANTSGRRPSINNPGNWFGQWSLESGTLLASFPLAWPTILLEGRIDTHGMVRVGKRVVNSKIKPAGGMTVGPNARIVPVFLSKDSTLG